jgi:NADPH-dependent F420 reductase
MADSKERVAILGGTGEQGLGLAVRFAAAGREVWIGSRKLERAKAAVEDVRGRVPDALVDGGENPDAVRAVPEGVVIVSVPFEHVVSTLKSCREAFTPGTVVVSMAVPLAATVGDSAARVLGVSQGSCAELCESYVPDGVEVVSAFQNVSAHRLLDLDQPVDCDVLVSGKKEARKRVMALCGDVPGTRGIDGGPLYNARDVEPLTALMIGLNIRYRVSEGTGLRFTYI